VCAGPTWPRPAGVVDAPGLAAALPAAGRLRLLSCAREGPPVLAEEAVVAVTRAAALTSALVVLDLPAAPTAAAEMALTLATRTVIVAGDDVRAAAAAGVVVRWSERRSAEPLLVVRVRPRARLRPAEVAASLGLPVAATVASDDALAVAADRGDLAHACRKGRAAATFASLLDTVLARAT
jgi:Flp pilus assembly CpaE family ATPase